MSEWKEYKLKDICLKITDGSHSSPKAQDKGYPMFSVKDMLEFGFDYSKCKYISEEDFQKLKGSDCVPLKGDILVAKDGSYLKEIFVCRETKDEGILSSIAIFRPNTNLVTSDFLCYLLKTPFVYNYIANNCVSGSALPRIVLKDFKEISLSIPSLDIQNKIVNKLKPLDDKIEVNRRINEQLEELAGALFKSWFVDFEPFKDGEFVESELGMIPEGWKVISFKDFITPSSEKAFVGDLPEYSVTNNGILPRDEKFKKQLSKTTSKNKVLKKNNLVFGMSREILNWGIMEDFIGGVSSAYNVYIIDEKLIHPTYLRLYMKAKITYFNDLIGNAAREGQSLDKTALLNKIVYLPCKDIWEDFLSKYNTIKEKISEGAKEITHLTNLRDTLLPKLMSGEIDVNEVEI